MRKQTKYVVDYFPCTSTFYHYLSSSLPSSSSSDSSDKNAISRRVRARGSDFDSSDDVGPSKIPKISGRVDTTDTDVEKLSSSDDGFMSSSFSSSSSSDSELDLDSDSDSDSDSHSDSSLSSLSFNKRPDASYDEEEEKQQVLLSEMDKCMIRPGTNMEGTKVDLISYLSTETRDYLVDKNGGKVSVKSSIEGKYVILIWLELPVISQSEAGYTCWALQSACSTWSSSTNNNVQVQLVVVPKAKAEAEAESFDSVLSGLPYCLAIPLWDSMNSASYSYVWDCSVFHPYTIVFDPNQTVLQQDCCYEIMNYGADFYPFTDEHLFTLNNTSWESLKERPFPLERLLGLELSDCLSNVAGDAKITVSQLQQKLVGVYVTFRFKKADAINQAYQDCLAKGRELEIVLACINLEDDPQHFMDSVYAALRDNDKGISPSNWWVLPYNDSTQRRLWKLLDNLHVGEDERIEELIIVGPRGEFFDPQTIGAASFDPIHDLYPYAIEVVAQQETARLQKLTLESMLISTTHNDDYLVTQQGNLMPVTELRGKNVLLFIANLKEGFDQIMVRMRDYWCPEIIDKCEVSNTAVVFVPLHSRELIFTKDLDPRMFWLWDPTIPWLISPPNHVREARIIKDLFLKGKGLDLLSCVAFGEDGQFVSNDLYDLSEYMANDFPPDHLYNNVLEQYCLVFNKGDKERWMVGY